MFDDSGIVVIGENINATRKIRASSPRVVTSAGKIGVGYTDLDGTAGFLDCSDIVPADTGQREGVLIPHVAQALRNKDLDYLTWAIRDQERCGAHIVDLCVDEISPYPEERQQWMRWLVKTAQSITGAIIAIDSSDPQTIRAGLEVRDATKGRPAINSFNLEEGKEPLIELAREHKALLFANASGRDGIPHNSEERVRNLTQAMEIMNHADIPETDRFLDPLVFPVGADGESGRHYLEAVRELRSRYPQVHIFGGHSNVSFGLPRRALLNNAFTLMAIEAGCDAIMIDPIMNPVSQFNGFRYAMRALTGQDEFAMQYLSYCRGE